MKKDYFITFSNVFDTKIKVSEKEFKKQLEFYCDSVEYFNDYDLKCLMFPLNNNNLQIVFYNYNIHVMFDMFCGDLQSILSILANYESLKDELNKTYIKVIFKTLKRGEIEND